MCRNKHYSTLLFVALLSALMLFLPTKANATTNIETITLNYSVKDVDVGSGFLLTAEVSTVDTSSITWSTSKSSVATVSASGYVSGKQAGTAVITATHTDSDGTTTSASCTVYVTVADGLYYIKNASSDLCFYTTGSSVSIQDEETDADTRLGQLWKITYVSDGRYEIRPIRDISVALTADSLDYVTVGATDAAACWGIVHNAFGYTIRFFGNSDESAKPIVVDMPGSQIYLGAWENSFNCHWKLERTYGIFLRDMETGEAVGDSVDVMLGVGRTSSLENFEFCSEYYGNLIGGITWSSSNSNIVSVNDSGQLTTVNPGVARITVGATLNGTYYSYSYYVYAESTVTVISNSDEGWLNSSQIMGTNLASAVGVEDSCVQAVNSSNFADIWNNTSSDHIIIHTHGTPNHLNGEDFIFTTQDISQLKRNSSIGFLLIIACSTGGENGGNANIATLLSQHIAEDGVVVCSTTDVWGESTEFWPEGDGEWIAYRDGVQISCDLPTTITMQNVADYWENFK